MPDTTVVDVKTSWASKINWTQAVGGLAMLLTFASKGALNITPEQQVAIVTAIGVIQSVVTWIMRTWFTTAVTPASTGIVTTTR